MSATRKVILLALVVVLLPGVTIAQPLPPSPIPIQPPTPPPGPPPVPPPSATLQPPALPPGPPPYPWPTATVPPAPSTGLADPGINGWPPPQGAPSPMPVLFVGLDFDVVKPVFKDHLQGTVTFADGTTSTLSVPRSDLSWTVSPRLELGYKLPDSLGEFLIGYRFLATDGTGSLTTADFGPVDVKTRLNMNIIDFDYNSTRSPLAPRFDMRWTIGARIATVFYDTRINNDSISESASNNFYGAGGHVGLELEHKLPVLPWLGVYAKGDAAFLVGEATQRFNESLGGEEASFSQRKSQSVETVSLQAGLSFTPTDYLRFTVGYEYEHWFSLGRIEGSNAELSTQGVYLRGQFDF